jgi:uncharacterized protein
MITYQTHLDTPEASSYLFKLCKHFARKIPVEMDEFKGKVAFPYGGCTLLCTATTLSIQCYGDSDDAARRVIEVLDSHIDLLTKKAPITLQWTLEPTI